MALSLLVVIENTNRQIDHTHIMFSGKDNNVNKFQTCLTKPDYRENYENIRSEKLVKSQDGRDNKKLELRAAQSYNP